MNTSRSYSKVPGDIDHKALDNILQRITKSTLGDIPTIDEKATAITTLNDGKTLGDMKFLMKYGSKEEAIRSAGCTN